MASITFAVDDNFKAKVARFTWINLSELVKQEIQRRLQILKQLNSKEEKEFNQWAVEVVRKGRRGRFEKLLQELPSEDRERLLNKT